VFGVWVVGLVVCSWFCWCLSLFMICCCRLFFCVLLVIVSVELMCSGIILYLVVL